jgi:pyruvate/2-oxoglutarate dehydrogenase complex dihydrolipoamide dehydrogenase (E3) component
MTVEYDLIVIGGSTAGTYAAVAAAHLNARVALVENEQLQTNLLGHSAIYTQALTQVGLVAQQVRDAPQFGIHFSVADSTKHQQVPSVALTEAIQWATTVVSTCSELNSPPVLASLGVDVITGRGEFCRRPHLGFVVNDRRLRARAYLIATGSRPAVPDIEGLQTIGYLTPADIWQEGLKEGLHVGKLKVEQELQVEEELQVGRLQVESDAQGVATASLSSQSSNLPYPSGTATPKGNAYGQQPSILENIQPSTLQGSWVVVGGGPIGTQLAQTLARLNCDVTLVVRAAQILSKEDPEASRLVQAQLEAEGVRVLTESPVTQVRRIDDKKWVQAGNHAIEADEILLATGQQPNVESLNLEGVGVKVHRQGLELNEKLQTTNPRIYACGDVIGGYQFAHIAQYEASIALKNALFAPLFKVDYRGIPWAIFCDPQLARVGLTEAQARLRYGKEVFVVRQYFKTLDKAQLLGETTGFCKIIGRQNGEILGASIVGPDASELIGAIALAIRQKIKVGAIADLPQVSPTLSEITQKTALEWQRQRLSRNQTLQNVLEGFFNLRRNWSS